MSRRNRKKQPQSQAAPAQATISMPAAGANGGLAAGWKSLLRPILIVVAIGLAATGAVWLRGGFNGADADRNTNSASKDEANKKDGSADDGDDVTKKTNSPGDRKTASFLDDFQGDKKGTGHEDKEAAAADDEMEKDLNELAGNRERQMEIKKSIMQGRVADQAEVGRLILENKSLVARFNSRSAALEKKLTAARRDRPKDPVPEWLTGELHKLVGGDPDKVLPHLQAAADAGLDRARLFASLASVQVENNQFDKAIHSARKALDRDTQDRYAWNAFERAAYCQEKFADIIERLDEVFPARRPSWATNMRAEATRMQAQWTVERKLRDAEKKANDLPRVRFIIKHRRFVAGKDGNPTKTEVTGEGEVVLELFEDQAPATVANFLALVSSGFYDGTRFHQSVAAMGVAGGDPESKKEDTEDDGSGGPGYTIPNESGSPRARRHFRGSLTMFNADTPERVGSQLMITLCSQPRMDGHFAVFGRVLKGQKVVDAITVGRTTKNVGKFGRVIPGDLLFKAEVIRKRPHEYKVIKLKK